MGKVSSLTNFQLEPGLEDYSFLDQEVAAFEQGLDSILTDSTETLELDIYLDEPNVITPSVSSGVLCSVSIISDTLNHSLLLASDLVNYGARIGHFFHLCFWPPRYQDLD